AHILCYPMVLSQKQRRWMTRLWRNFKSCMYRVWKGITAWRMETQPVLKLNTPKHLLGQLEIPSI
ncbi:hypothetical protein E8E15_001863, partial [Penicillium rubens]